MVCTMSDVETAPNPRPPSILDRISELSNALGSALILLLMVLMCSDVASRNLLMRPIPVVAELVASILVMVVFLQLACAVQNDRLARTEMILHPLSRRWPWIGRALNAAFNLLGCAVCVIIAWKTFPTFTKSIADGEFIGLVGVFTMPNWPFSLAVIFGAALAALQFLVMAYKSLRGDLPSSDGIVE